MPSNLINRTYDVTAAYVQLETTDVICSVTVTASPDNVAPVYFLGDNGSDDVAWAPGEYHAFHSANLKDFQVKGTVGDLVTAVGGTWA